VDRIGGGDMTGQAEFQQQLLHGGEVSTANALSTCLAFLSLKLSKLPLGVLPSNVTTRAFAPTGAQFRLAASRYRPIAVTQSANRSRLLP
jgi:hypothetical protein